jgi:hypothetical protein
MWVVSVFAVGVIMKRHYLHLSAYPCDACEGPVIAASTAVRESEICKETDIKHIGAICLLCGRRQAKATEPARARHLPPIQWDPIAKEDARNSTDALVEALNSAELH